jgi:ribosomal protein L24
MFSINDFLDFEDMHMTFSKGDRVEIYAGTLKGRKGEIRAVYEGTGYVHVVPDGFSILEAVLILTSNIKPIVTK